MVGLGVLGVFGLGASAAAVAVLVFFAATWLDRPLPVFGFDEGPDQPIAFPHTVHVEEMGLDCTFCHRNVTKGEAATIPAVNLCMSCHIAVGDGLPEVEKLRDIHERGEPIDWVRVHRVPDHVQFVHEAHVRRFSGMKTVVEQVQNVETEIRRVEAERIDPRARVGDTMDIQASQTCAICHGDVGSMTKVKQVRSLKMGDCVDCHRENSAPTDCTTCHY
jgi:nitrate/TMAO reductase-like tetraheme cytochrome c subunit